MSPTRIAQLIGGGLTALLAVGLLALGGFALWADGEKDRDGYVTTDAKSFSTTSRALVTENLDIDLDGAGWLVDTTDLGEVRLRVSPSGDEPVFVGIARTGDVAAYLRGVGHTTVHDIDYAPFEAAYRPHEGTRRPGRPSGRRIWAASTQGRGTQTLNWDVQDGDWQVVVMNADGSPGVLADVSAGAKVPYLTAVGWSSLGGGVLALIGAAGLIALGARSPRRPAPATSPAPAAS